ncbi:ABC transporter permease [Halovenus rubra]|uniref:ABC transporter permease n=2 Tax=Halovenus rubra TaxID=869890 RepID=A0ACC7DY55_9EURY|nr:ABC transporter permease [Halovenus rubra]
MSPPPDTNTDAQAETTLEQQASSSHDRQFEAVSFDTKRTATGLSWIVVPTLITAVLSVLIVSAIYSVWTESDTLPIAGFEVEILNWLYGLALLFVTILVTKRVITSPERTAKFLGRIRRQKTVLVAAVTALFLFLIGSIVPFLTNEPLLDPLISLQPPGWSSVSEVFVPTCHGTVVDGQCQGTASYPLGTNALGQDVLAMGWLGLNTTLQVAMTASTIAATFGVVVGVSAGYLGGRVDEMLMRYVDIQRALPAFFLYILLVLRFGRSYPLMILVFGLLSWGGIARVVRSEVIQLKTTSFVQAAQLSGAEAKTIIRRHILPAVTGTVLTTVAVLFAKFAVYEAALAFLWLTEIDAVSLGSEIATAVGRQAGDNTVAGGSTFDWWSVPWVVYVPAGILCTLLLVVSFLGDRVQEMVDPRT